MKNFFKRLFNYLKEVGVGRIIVGGAEAVAAIGGTIYMIKDAKNEKELQKHNDEVISQAVTAYLDNYMNDEEESEESEEN